MKLYHLRLGSQAKKEFKPEIPLNRGAEEDAVHERICLSDSIEGCLSSVSWGGNHLEEQVICRLSNKTTSLIVRVYVFDTESILSENLITPKQIIENGWVEDAGITHEHWVVNQTLIPESSFLIKITDYIDDDVMVNDYEYRVITSVTYEIVPDEQVPELYLMGNKVIFNGEINRKDVERVIEQISSYYGGCTKLHAVLRNNCWYVVGELDATEFEFDEADLMQFTNEYVLTDIKLSI